MRSALQSRLSEEEWTKLQEFASQRVTDLIAEREGSQWWADRERAERMAASNFDHRRAGETQDSTIFDKKNFSVQLVRSTARFVTARLVKDIFGSKPWLSIQPQGPTDGLLATQIQDHAPWKLDQAKYSAQIKGAIETAVDLGECAVATTWKVEEDTFETYSAHLYDKATKEPVRGPDGELLLDTDETFEEILLDEAGNPVLDPETGKEMPTGRKVFVKAPEVEIPSDANSYDWADEAVEETVRLYHGPKCSPAYWKDVFWPINAPCLSESDFVFRRYDTTPDELRRRFPGEDGKENADIEDFLNEIKGQGAKPKVEGGQARDFEGEPPALDSSLDKEVIGVAECYFKTSVLGNGKCTRVWMLLHPESQKAIWADYLATISPRSEYPIHLITVNKVKGRAFGRGFYQMFEMASEIIDGLLNSIVWRNEEHSNPLKIVTPGMTKEQDADPNIKYGPGVVLTVKQQGADPSKVIHYSTLPDLDDRTWQLMELFMQLIQTESGAMNPNQSTVGGLPTNDLATGINAQTEISSVLHLYTLEEIRDSLTPQLRYTVALIYFKQDEDETYEYMEGQAQEILRLVDAQALRKLALNVEILLSRAKRQEMREAAMAAIPLAEGFYQQIVPIVGAQALVWMAKKTLPLRIQAMRGLEIDNADQIFPDEAELDEAILMQQQMVQAAADAEAQQAEGEGEGGSSEEPMEEPMILPSNVIPDQAPV